MLKIRLIILIPKLFLNFYKLPFLVYAQSNFFPLSPHYTHIYEIVALAGIRDMLPENLIIYGVKGKDFTMGINLSNEVRKAISRVAGCLISEIEKGPDLSLCMRTI